MEEEGVDEARLLINEAQLVLAEKRTSLAAMRTGIAVFALPMSVLSVLIATSRYYEVTQVVPLLVPLLVICAGLVTLGSYLMVRSLLRLRRQDCLLKQLKKKDNKVAALLE